ncbi:MAG: purine-nucleoside phosphorylase [Desulfuromonadales bacterium]|nr:purine-nucleoside phosphorylase [Desulfuromonadales bacterium]
MKPLDDVSRTVQQVQHWLGSVRPLTAIVLGSGLSGLLSCLENSVSLAYDELVDFPAMGVDGHVGCLYRGKLFARDVILFQGRYHCYEGYNAWQVSAPVRLAAALGCQQVLLTNAAGGLLDEMVPGDFMLVTDHLNLTGLNPLAGRAEKTFLDLAGLYDQDFFTVLHERLRRQNIRLHSGVLAWMPGPTYETPAEIRALEQLGAAAVSMSTIPEAVVAKRYAMSVAAFSLIANLACGKSDLPLHHDEVLKQGRRVDWDFSRVVETLFSYWPTT